MTSRNFTVIAANISPIPTDRHTKSKTGTTKSNIVKCSSALVTIITIKSAQHAAIKLIRLEQTLGRTNIYFGTYTFFITAAFPTTADIALVVASLKKLYIVDER